MESQTRMFRPELLSKDSTVSSDAPDCLDQQHLLQILKKEFKTFQEIESVRVSTLPYAQRVQIGIRLAGEHSYSQLLNSQYKLR